MIGVMPCLPQTFALSFIGIPSEVTTAEFFDNIRKHLSLFGDAGICTMKLYK